MIAAPLANLRVCRCCNRLTRSGIVLSGAVVERVRAGKRRYQRVTIAVCEQCCETIAAMVRGDERKGAA